MRAKRLADSLKSHTLIAHTPGINRFIPGSYLCSCGQTLTGINKFESHIAEMRREIRGKTK